MDRTTKRIVTAAMLAIMASCVSEAQAGIWDHLNLFKSRNRRPTRPVYVPFDHPTYGHYATRWRKFPGSHGQYHEMGFAHPGMPFHGGVVYEQPSFGMSGSPAIQEPIPGPSPASSSAYEPLPRSPVPTPAPAPLPPVTAPAPPVDTLPLPSSTGSGSSAMRPARSVYPPAKRVSFSNRPATAIPRVQTRNSTVRMTPGQTRATSVPIRTDFGLPKIRPATSSK